MTIIGANGDGGVKCIYIPPFSPETSPIHHNLSSG